ncbi:ArsC/Spx/MgsR family protein [Spirochaetia bacterium 38H-sp]|uniref:ArsC/Spx/MgsR family protein n=1 Tax=Rarispira pelagica TaxID=3141764 RepID=A0ABU9UBU8_9SPIR
MMSIVIYGTNKCKVTQKAIRFFKERGINPQFFDLRERSLSGGEAKKIYSFLGDDVLDKDSSVYKKRFAYYDAETEELIVEYPELIKTPVVKCGQRYSCGFDESSWKVFCESVKV